MLSARAAIPERFFGMIRQLYEGKKKTNRKKERKKL